jgi:hypothetical protein
MPNVFLLLLALGGQQPRFDVPVVAMKDQFEKPHDVRWHRGDVVVLIYGDRRSADANKSLGALLHVAFHPTAKGLPPAQARQAPVVPIPGAPAGVRHPDVLVIPVACIGKVPALVRSLIRAQFRGASPDVPVWLDFDDRMKLDFGFEAGLPNVVVLDALGRYRYHATGTPTPESTTRLLEVLQALRREAMAKKD